MRGDFPFSGVVGQDEAKLALLLAALDPRIGGVLLRGDKGSAKSTLARGLAALLRPGAPFVELPIGATEDRVVGGLDVGAALSGRSASLRPGLIAAAHGGVLYVDEVNLLPDHLVDLLLDAAASGVHRVERDGISHTQPTRFVLVGSMNPEEGELRPQLLDRFGLSVEVRAPTDPGVRARVVMQRLAFDRAERAGGGDAEAGGTGTVDAGEAIAADLVAQDALFAARLIAARPAVVGDDVAMFACRLALASGAEGMRADLVLCRAAAANAAWEGRPRTTGDDVERVAGLALAHRRRRRPFDPPDFPSDQLEEAIATARRDGRPPPAVQDAGGAGGEDAGGAGGEVSDHGGEWDTKGPVGPTGDGGSAGSEPAGVAHGSGAGGNGAGRMAPIDDGGRDTPGPVPNGGPTGREWSTLPRRAFPSGPEALGLAHAAVRGPPTVAPGAPGALIGDRRPGPDGPRGIAVMATVRAGIARRAMTGADADVATGDLREPVRRRIPSRCIVVAVDASGSMGSRARVEAAGGAVIRLLADAYRHRHRVALVAFRGDAAEVVLAPTASVEIARARLTQLPTGGTTPLAEGLDVALATAVRSASDGDTPLLVVITDGRATAGPDALGRALAAAGRVADAGIEALVLDAEDGRGRLMLADQLAGALRAPCVALAALSADTVDAAIRATWQPSR